MASDSPRGDIIARTLPGAFPVAQHPPWLQQRLEWFRDQKLGLILHWGPYCQWDCYESWGLVKADSWARLETMRCWVERDRDFERFSRDYRALNRTFDPREFDPAVWAAAAVDAGMRYVCFTTKHHDGFCLWDTATTAYKVTAPDCPHHTHPQADLVRAVFDALRQRGLGISAYFSKSDWHCPWYWSPDFPLRDRHPNYDTAAHPALWAQFQAFVREQIRELLTDYGPIDALWLDGGQVRPPHQDIQMPALAALARSLQPGLLIADRTVGGEFENFITPEQEVLDRALDYPWESCITLGGSWKYMPGKMDYRPARAVIHQLCDIVCKGGNLLLGIGPTPQGTFDSDALARLREIGAWLRVNGAAIYGTRPVAPFRDGDVCYTGGGGLVYATVLHDEVAPSTVALALPPAAGSPVRRLAGPTPLSWRWDGQRALVDLPPAAPTAATVLCYRAAD
ncbi:MAG: alpha-L-fucosidase [Fimbriimonadaceae bacterium]|nr:alpha-L-fucosidase [Fimbriimonadaceae bacterium]